MNWEKIKKIVIWILIGMNVVLFGFNSKKDQKYILSSERERAIYSVLARHNIGMYTQAVSRFDDMRRISVEIPEFSRDELAEDFFPGEESEYIVEDDWMGIAAESGEIMFKDEEFEYYSYAQGQKIPDFSEEGAREAAEGFVKSHGKTFENFQPENVEKVGESYVCTYAGVYKGYRIFCMNLTVSVNEYGVRGAAGSLFSIRGYYGLSSPICAPDEALMTLLHSIETDGQTRFITEMDLGYDLQESGDVSGNLKLVPCYYMYLQGESRPIIVDAYTNEIKS